MRLVSCFADRSEIAPLVKAGADELYTSARGLPSFTQAGMPDMRSLLLAVDEIHSLGAKALVAMNAVRPARNEAGMRTVLARARSLEARGADGFIVAAPSLMSLFSGGGVRTPLHLSSVQPCFNTAALRFFLRFGVKRLILPSQLAPREASALFALCRSEGLETEIFDYRFFGCVYVNGRCNLHFPRFHTVKRDFNGGSLCRLSGGAPLKVTPVDLRPGAEEQVKASARRVALRMGCGGAPRFYNAATFYDLFAMGAGWLKYGTRLDPTAEKVRKVRAMKAMSGLAEELTAKYGAAEARPRFIEKMTKWELR